MEWDSTTLLVAILVIFYLILLLPIIDMVPALDFDFRIIHAVRLIDESRKVCVWYVYLSFYNVLQKWDP